MYDNILARVFNQPHLVRPEKLQAICRLLGDRMAGVYADSQLLAELRAENQQRRQTRIERSVAVLPVLGTLAKRMGMMDESSGGTSTDRLGRDLDALFADDSVGAILLDVDSPGGEVFGVPELADKIFAARGRKPIAAIANAEMASGALWIGMAADSVSITPSGWIGSLGVFMAHTDISAMNEQLGVKTTYISAGEYKVEGNRDSPLTDDAKAYYQNQVEAVYDQFLKAVARFRGTTAADVKANYGKGRMLRAAEAKAAGMVDRIETMDEAIARLSGNRKTGARARVEKARWELGV